MNEFEIVSKRFANLNEQGTSTINNLQATLRALEVQLSELKVEWQRMLIREIEGEKVNLKKCQTRMREVESEISVTKELLATAEYHNKNQLAELIFELEIARNNAHKDICNEVTTKSDNLKRKRCEFLLAAKEIGEIQARGGELERKFLNAVRLAYGSEQHATYKPSRKVGYPIVNLYSDNEGVFSHVAPNTYEVMDALNFGKVPFFVIWYGLYKELLSENEARKRLEEIKRLKELKRMGEKSNG
ncbi:hypothetical protein [Desulfosporosinus sp. Sb-LF]|uniref:hypothetical protein n=1 Tax=Desulfosporosinus sp. Sb-LF TaxID=2560027 RepID=UPI00107F5552|nr:hypothetical protein [Desulfosporosinus sp. Sb-LF]TGE32860.1 hypothetical protein E4K68_08400 [Desulfosporosinus sp. Sb-LF]